MINTKKILIIEDQPEHASLIRNLLGASPDHHYVTTLASAKKLASRIVFDLILMDLVLPDGLGYEFLQEIQETENSKAPVLVLSARVEVTDKIYALELGAVDFITKPYHPRELKAKIHSHLRLAKESRTNGSVAGVFGDCTLDPTKHHLVTPNRNISLTTHEFQLLNYFSIHREQIMSREKVIESVWGDDRNVVTRSVDTLVSRVRKKLSGTGYTIRSIYGAGYVFEPSRLKLSNNLSAEIQRAMKFFDGDLQVTMRVIESFYETAEQTLNVLANVTEHQDKHKLLKHMHNFRGSVGYFSANLEKQASIFEEKLKRGEEIISVSEEIRTELKALIRVLSADASVVRAA